MGVVLWGMKSPTPRTAARAAFLFCTLLGTAITALHGQALPSFTNASVHDPSIVKAGSEFWVFGSHMASARSTDLINWTQYSSSPTAGNPLAPNPSVEFSEGLTWAQTTTFWAPDVIQLADGKFYMYYCMCKGDQPLSALGVARADSIGGPYTNLGLMLKSGMYGQTSPDGTNYDAVRHPNAVDPDVFFDKAGKLWMIYGSYSGGIFIIELDPATGFQKPGQGYGKKLIGGNHSRIEGAFVLYSPESDYYYMFLSFGGLDAVGGYNIRVGRSRNPDGPYLDAAGTDLTTVQGNFSNDALIAPHGVKLMGNYQFLSVSGEPPGVVSRGYLSPGHNSAYYDPVSGKHFLVFHTRFVGRGEEHEVRVHQLVMNADEWLVATPHRYVGENLAPYQASQIPGEYKLINHGKATSSALVTSSVITLHADNSITGAASGTWALSADFDVTLTLGGVTYKGVFVKQWDDDNGVWVHTFSALSANGVAVWGSRVAKSSTPPATLTLEDRMAIYGNTLTFTVPKPNAAPGEVYSYALANGPAGATINLSTGVLSWKPLLSQIDTVFPVSVRVLNTSADDPAQTTYNFNVSATAATVVQRLDLDFSSVAGSGLRDASGQFTGLNARLPGTGASVAANDPNLTLNTGSGKLDLRTTRADLNGRTGLAANSSPGVALNTLGFSGSEDFSVTAVIRPLPALGDIDQAGVYVGNHSDSVTRAGTIVWGTTAERYSSHGQNGVDNGGRFFGFGFNGADGMTVTITRQAGVWRYFVDGVEWNPTSGTTFLNGRSDLVVGVFGMTPLNSNVKTLEIDSFSAVVATATPLLSTAEQWRVTHFAQIAGTGQAADTADADADGLPNLMEYAVGGNPRIDDSGTVAPVVAKTAGAGARLTLTFNRIADPALTYTVEASAMPSSGYAPIWTSTGVSNTAGPVTVTDTVDIAGGPRRFLRLRVDN
ncbi:hypothetical protein CMV30_10880 [Nibricoccus aquaticus]|uniref:Extracellular endo-alpha-(1->5)-L-arabinanase C-terminal domain-containing protein n=2 Tax=Nibricoccus aquaticus TaxID=2576891 RepID=A0A290Q6Z6_9BACT|nr:hypothetical protein CMV30_10880 [Nibricoccus aquaticus]